jgi:nucleotide-binding universal stress UspA family protein
MSKKLLVPVDGSDHAFKALDFASELAAKNASSICLLYVVNKREVPESVRHFAESERIEGPPELIYEKVIARNILQAALERVRGKGLTAVEAMERDGDPAKVIAEVANTQGFDAIVMGTRGLSDIRGLIMGSVAHKVNHLAKCTVITVK